MKFFFHHYPIKQNYKSDVNSQILNTADKYTALREQRSYKNALSKEEALDIIYQDVVSNNLEPEIFNTLKKVV